ncbi:MAG: helix-turn-helix domain-containing protein [Pirellulales bacterium]|nr:helix-turn-helix domain-containing protein [Pirellulales bacterium]
MTTTHDRPAVDDRLLAAPAYTTRDLARLARVTPRTLHAWRARHGLPYLTLPGGAIRYPVAAVDAWLAARGRNLTPYARDLARATSPTIPTLATLAEPRRAG